MSSLGKRIAERAMDKVLNPSIATLWNVNDVNHNDKEYSVRGFGMTYVSVYSIDAEGIENYVPLGDFDCEWLMGKAIQQEVDKDG